MRPIFDLLGLEVGEDIDLKLEFDINPQDYVVSNWTLIEWHEDEDPTIIYLKSAKRSDKNLMWGDTLGAIGGFIVLVQAVFNTCASSVN